MSRSTVILHGWSDCSDSFKSVKRYLMRNGLGQTSTIYYADYESREDNITFDDVVGGLNDELRSRGLIDAQGHGDINVIVHSTGGLVVRHWIWRYYADRPDECPVRNLVMLAPANFGSPLAHRGKSFLGQLFKGRWKIGDLLEVGRELLSGLELASPYQWQLAHRDVLRTDPFYDTDRIRLTVLVGLNDYTGLRGWVNKPGTDGTVVIAGTPLNTVKFRLDFCRKDVPLSWERSSQLGRVAFGALRGYDHGSIVGAFDEFRRKPDQAVLRCTLRALSVRTAAQFIKHCEVLDRETREAYAPKSAGEKVDAPTPYQQFIVHGVDDQGRSIRDFTLEFFVRKADRSRDQKTLTSQRTTAQEDDLSRDVQKLLTSEFHTHTRDSSYRRILVDGASVKASIPEGYVLAMRIYVPRVDGGIYYDTRNTQDIVVYDSSRTREPQLFFPNTTTLIELVVDRVTEYVTVSTTARKH